MNYTDKITRIIVDMYKPNGPKNKSNVDVYDMSDSFNARVGDEQIPLMIEYRERGIIERMTSESLTPFAMGYVGQPDEHGKVTAETGVAVSYHGSSDDVIGAGKVKMDLPGAMFPQEGMFYGFFGLENSAGKRITSNDVCFEVKNGNPDMYVDSMPFRSELQKLLDEAVVKADTTIGDIKAKWETLRDTILEMIKQGDTDLTSLKNRMGLAEADLDKLLKEINDATLLKQADLDEALVPIDDRLDKLESEKDSSYLMNDVGGGIRDIFTDQIGNMRSRINPDIVNIGMLNDVHYTDRDTYWGPDSIAKTGITHILNLASVSDLLDYAVSVGDNTDDNADSSKFSEKRIMDYGTTWFTALECPSAILIGNHDDNSSHALVDGVTGDDFIVKDSYFAKAYRQNINLFGEKRNGDSNYFYYDIPDKNVRVIGIDDYENPHTFDDDGKLKYPRIVNSIITDTQLNWLATDALQVPSDTHVAIFIHCPINGTTTDNPTNICINHDVLKSLLEAYVSGTNGTLVGSNTDFPTSVKYSFASRGNLIGVFAGHVHYDDYKQVDGINYVANLNSVGSDMPRPGGKEYFNTNDEDSWAVIGVDTSKRHVKLIKFGRGTDMDFDY